MSGGDVSHQGEEAEFYEKILRLRDDVLTGKHPRYKLPERIREHGDAVSPPGHALPATNSAPRADEDTREVLNHKPSNRQNGLQNGAAIMSPASHEQPPGPSKLPLRVNPVKQPASVVVQRHPVPQRPVSKPFVSGIDPVLLSKSDQLVKAEIQLKRQRIERALKDQVDQKKAHGREREAILESSILDVTRLFKQALAIVKPISGLQAPLANGHSPNSDTFDENSYYSSQVNDWSSDDAINSQKTEQPQEQQKKHQEEQVDLADVHHASFSVAVEEKGKQPDGVPPAEAGAPLVDAVRSGAQPLNRILRDTTPDPVSVSVHGTESGEERDESYSPPAPEAFSAVPANQNSDNIGTTFYVGQSDHGQTIQSRDHRAHAPPRVGAKRFSPPLAEVPIIRNHIASPLAPKPSRISPLAIARTRTIDQGASSQASRNPRPDRLSPKIQPVEVAVDRARPTRGRRNSPGNIHLRSPIVQKQQTNKNPRKRRREVDANEMGPPPIRKRIARSPEPYIKEEPLSPPPLVYLKHPLGTKPQSRAYEYVELHTAEGPGPVMVREAPQPQRLHAYHAEDSTSRKVFRVPSQGTWRSDRDGLDSRDMASPHYAARLPSPPRPYLSQVMVEKPRTRAASFAYVDQPCMQQARYAKEPSSPALLRSVRSDRSMSPPAFRERLVQRFDQPGLMAPPPPRYIVDQYGTRYYAALPEVEVRQTTAPIPRRVDMEAYHEPPYAERSTAQTPYKVRVNLEAGSSSQRPLVPGRVVEQPDVEFIDQRVYRERAYQARRSELLPPREEQTYGPAPSQRRPVSRLNPAVSLAGQEDYYMGPASVQPEHTWREGPHETVHGYPRAEYVTGLESIRAVREYGLPMEAPRPAARAISTARGGEQLSADERIYVSVPEPQRRGIAYEQLHDRPMERMDETYDDNQRRLSYRY